MALASSVTPPSGESSELVPFQGRRAVYAGVRLRDRQLSVAVRCLGQVEWVPAGWALTEAEAAA